MENLKLTQSEMTFDFFSQFANYKLLEEGYGLKRFTCSVIELQKEYAEQGQIVYAYNFNHRSQENPWPEYMGRLMFFSFQSAVYT